MGKINLAVVTRSLNKAGLQLKKHAPEIMVGAGVVGTVVATVLACKETAKAIEARNTLNEELAYAHAIADEKPEEYTKEDVQKAAVSLYAKTAVEYAKIYAPSVLIGAASITSILAGHNMLRKRTAAISAAYAILNNTFKDYRGRVVDRFGAAIDKELRYNIKTEAVDVVEIDENGKESVKKELVQRVELNNSSDYSKIYDCGCAGWTKDPEHNREFLKMQERYATDKLRRQGYLFLNDVYDALGIPRTKAGFVVGWMYNEKCPVGDNFVSFGLDDVSSEAMRRFNNGYEANALLDFNVDGNIVDMM